MTAMTNITGNETQTKTFEGSECSLVWVGEFKQQSVSLSAVNILLSITATLGNSLILVALHKESSLHSPSKLLYRCLATTDLLIGLVTQPLCYLLDVLGSRTLESLSILKLCNRRNRLCVMFSFIVNTDGHKRGSTSRPFVGNDIQRDCNFEAYIYHFSYLLVYISIRWFILAF